MLTGKPLGEAIKTAIEKKGVTKVAVAKAFGIKPPSVNSWISTGRVSKEHIGKLVEYFSDVVTPQHFGLDVLIDYNTSPAPMPRGVIPLISMVQAGSWSEIVDNFHAGAAEDWVASFGHHSKHSFAVQVQGVSMQNHGHKESFDHGDIVLVDPDLPADNGSLVIVRLDDRNEATFKKLHHEGGERYLVPLNPDWPEKIIPINGNATICGVVYQKIVRF